MDPTPWRPAVRLDPELTPLVNRLVRRRRPWGAAGMQVSACAPPDAVDGPERLPLRLGGQPAVLEAPRALVDAVLAVLDPAAPAATGEARRLLIELALEEVLDALAPMLAAEERDGGLGRDAVPLGLRCRSGDTAWTVCLHLGRPAAEVLAALLDGAAPAWVVPAALRVPVCLRLGCCTLSAAEVRALRPGDVLLPGQGDGTAAVAVAGERLVWHGRRDGSEIRVGSARRGAAESGAEEWTMSSAAPPDTAGPVDADLTELPVRLVFEAGRLELPLGELGGIGPGHVFALPGGPPGRVDILANGRRIGQGELVQLGDGAGVRLLSLNGRGAGQG